MKHGGVAVSPVRKCFEVVCGTPSYSRSCSYPVCRGTVPLACSGGVQTIVGSAGKEWLRTAGSFMISGCVVWQYKKCC